MSRMSFGNFNAKKQLILPFPKFVTIDYTLVLCDVLEKSELQKLFLVVKIKYARTQFNDSANFDILEIGSLI